MIPLANGKTLRTLNIIDDFNREVLSITVDTSLPSQRVIRELETLAEWRGRPDTIRSDNSPEFISEALSQWCKKSGVEWVFIEPGKLTPLNQSQFPTLQQANYSNSEWNSLVLNLAS